MGTDNKDDGGKVAKSKTEKLVGTIKRRPIGIEQTKIKFKGSCESLKGFVFDCVPSKAQQVEEHNKTVEQMKMCIGSSMGPLLMEVMAGKRLL